METQTRFNLNHAIRHWRDRLSQSPNFRADNLDELEAHLRDSVAAFQRAALSEEEAFLVAARRLGAAPALEPEFAKVNGREIWINRLLWMLTGILLWSLLGSLSRVTGDAGLIAAMLGFGYTPSVSKGFLPGVFFGLVGLGSLALCVLGTLWFINRVGGSLARVAAYLLQRPAGIILAVVAVSLLLLGGYAASWAETAWLARRLGPASYGALAYSKSLGYFFTVPLETFALVTAACLLARRRLRQPIET